MPTEGGICTGGPIGLLLDPGPVTVISYLVVADIPKFRMCNLNMLKSYLPVLFLIFQLSSKYGISEYLLV